MDWTTTVTAIGTLLGGLALPLAFIQLGALRQDRLRAQINKVGAWGVTPERLHEAEQGQPGWKISLSVRNSSELPIVIQQVKVAVQAQRGRRLSFASIGQPVAFSRKWGYEESLPPVFPRETVDRKSVV